ncbi:hypothetical protein DYH11_04050 [Candidatus Microgenomates bacterium CPR3]|nr:hypothetical protein [Candidatus Microgenomates bacterium CPR3]
MRNIKKPITVREQVIVSLVRNQLRAREAAELLGCTPRTVRTYLRQYLLYGVKGLVDHRHSNNHKLSDKVRAVVVKVKREQRWRSPRNIRDALGLDVHECTVWRLLAHEGLAHENLKRVKAITRFEASTPNAMWQTDIMGKITFNSLGDLYLIGTLDDHSRFVPHAAWYKSQHKMNVFAVWYESLAKWGIPKAMLQDKGSQYKARTKYGSTEYEWYAKQLGIELIWAESAQCKGKIERFWKFVQRDFVPSVLKATTLEEVSGKWRLWLAWYNYKFKSKTHGGTTHANLYHPSERRVKRLALETMLLVEERRKVSRESTISLYGKSYLIPPGYIGCRIWIQIKGNKLYMEANGESRYLGKLRL